MVDTDRSLSVHTELHAHSIRSDGTDTPTRLVKRAAECGLAALALTDHDGVSGLEEAATAAAGAGVELIPGIELSCRHDGADIHLLGWFIDPADAALGRVLATMVASRETRLAGILERLARAGAGIEPDAVRRRTGGVTGRPHIAAALVEAGHAVDLQDAFVRWLRPGRPAWVPLGRPQASEGIARIRGAGGVACLAHPGLGVPDRILAGLAAAGVSAIEADHPGHTQRQRRRYRETATRLGLVPTGGSDFHGDAGRHGSLGAEAVPESTVAAIAARRA